MLRLLQVIARMSIARRNWGCNCRLDRQSIVPVVLTVTASLSIPCRRFGDFEDRQAQAVAVRLTRLTTIVASFSMDVTDVGREETHQSKTYLMVQFNS